MNLQTNSSSSSNISTNVTQVITIDGMGQISPMSASDFDVLLLTHEHVQQTALALALIFSQEEPLAIGTSTSPPAYFPYAYDYCKRCAEGGLSHIAIDKSSNMVVGFHLCSDADEWVEPHSNDEGILLHLRLLDDLHAIYEESQQNNHHGKGTACDGGKKIFKICSAGTYAFARRVGLAKRMFNEALQLAKEKKYDCMMVECTGFASQALYAKIGFKEIARVNYEEYEVVDYLPNKVNGGIIERRRRPFKTIPTSVGTFINLMVMDL
ncbi:hypothetical protein FDP41_001108 [Naegleria fowleri]|uniref:N-acetyltransferase domain-containing protein n=1 Tax=Naegleria fowleri TaxID=5763 RepID=A0A6A5C366_NAEFO|nr:uncharacterized protein FDP41_001108 [Naegleria fowleri]KAF0979955.1 hypothetical protein FDP41_001108 [Naegleria fowleri]CAG4708316.1 unnamed protein product [Naegleria fowleri]